MNRTPQLVCAMICTISAIQIATAQSSVHKVSKEPTSFSEDGSEFSRSAPIPDCVLDVVRQSEEAKSAESAIKEMSRNEFAQLFKAIVIHLHGLQERDYVLLSEFPMAGADAPWFWIVRFDPVHPKVIFFTFANGFELLKTIAKAIPIFEATLTPEARNTSKTIATMVRNTS